MAAICKWLYLIYNLFQIFNNTIYNIEDNGESLIINKIGIYDARDFTCLAVNYYEVTSKIIYNDSKTTSIEVGS